MRPCCAGTRLGARRTLGCTYTCGRHRVKQPAFGTPCCVTRRLAGLTPKDPVCSAVVSTRDDPPRPPVVPRRGGGRVGPFGALIVAAATDPDAARGLASAYASLAVAARRRIIEAVLSDAIAEGISAS